MLKIYDIDPDGLRVIINWDSMRVGMSVFIPCVNTDKALRQLKNVLALKEWQYETRIVIEDSMLGVRVWRTM
jgi:hypothetical protein